MPPKTRRTKASKQLKENECVVKSKTIKGTVNNTKPLRKALADKTNSASDDNTSIHIENVTKSSKSLAKSQNQCENNNLRPRRTKKLPNRSIENVMSPSLSNNKENPPTTKNILKTAKLKIPQAIKEPVSVITPLKLPVSDLDNSLLKKRPKRICRLPSKFDGHSISPNKFIPLQPINASTPLTDKAKIINKEKVKKPEILHNKTKHKSDFQRLLQSSKTVTTQTTIRSYLNKAPSDTNNNAKQTKLNLETSVRKSPATKTTSILRKDTSDNVKEKTLKRNSNKVDVYEFTYDPNEEPPPPKKKKKKVVRKPAKPKMFTFKNNYDKNLAKSLATLKHTVATKSSPKIMNEQAPIKKKTMLYNEATSNKKQNLNINESINERNYNSVRVEDIALDMQVEDDNIDYVSVNSPSRPKTPGNQNVEKPPEPSNPQDISFFDDLPAAHSSMNSSRHPLASPWRVEFGSLPIKWQVNTYVKPNMTPAFESSFINFNDSKKRHVYTNIVPDANVSLPQIVDSPNLKQTSIISFIKEVVEKSANKKKKIKATPVKANSLFEDTNTSILTENSSKTQMKTTKDCITPKIVPIENNSNNTSSGTDNENVHNNDQNEKSDENNTYFGFNDTEDQENISPKKKNKARSLRARTRGILQELNSQRGPMRAVIPVIAKSKSVNNTEGLNKLFGEVKSATEPPVFPEPSVNSNNEVTIIQPSVPEVLDIEDSQSVHLFEDIDVVHYQKLIRKSYGKPKRVAVRKNTTDSDTSPLSGVDQASSDEDLDDLSFKLPMEKPKKVIKKKKTKKQMLSKKEEKEVEAWAAGFNSMCEDIDEFDLVVE